MRNLSALSRGSLSSLLRSLRRLLRSRRRLLRSRHRLRSRGLVILREVDDVARIRGRRWRRCGMVASK